ncbi:hypothetical protein [Massilia sp. YIM B04103]|uniref:hypothetical protein n=1 Tax=Massilia sp. YIM B04103 TaxID=2963106 RepID=UPI00210D79B9|nr:hypothetical protein [Massilia sp. YIM B04103]
MIKPTFIAAALLLGLAAMAPAAMAQVDVSIVVGSAPPPVRLETMPPPRSGYIWAPGYWNWDGYRHVWLPGRWETERYGMYYQQPVWIHTGSGWRLDRGGWVTNRIGGRSYVALPPPPPRYEPAPGYWDHRGNTQVWIDGGRRPHNGGHWNDHNHGRGHGRDGWRDSDHDGVPNRYDRDRDNDGIPNRRDRDRDGDGVPNRYDRRPDNPHRR